MSQKLGDGGDDIFMSTGIEESQGMIEQTSLQKSVYSNINTGGARSRILDKDNAANATNVYYPPSYMKLGETP